ncbi:iron complex transport system permease protein [Lipingzhangella halophila]|uniref:Iron complex transport system permease protein n=1 Tax=Lipingzhangella halophila TaxID=1783352 RepID=A0A7W7REB6_9ACTN|nr:iron chelate uptake ABC transporter family permease subunit [Lipingzhangella halophila]MBB4930427.1 iron complex transport system permease protein [Lipingzhangella halophila]
MSQPNINVVRVGEWSARFRPRALAVVAGCSLVAVALGVLAIGAGAYPMSPSEVVRALGGAGSAADLVIVHDVRLPRVATALLVGSALALSGAVFQTLTRNPLGSPDILGFTQGATTGAMTVIVVIGAGTAALSVGAVVGGVLTGVLMYALLWPRGLHGYRLVLLGIGVAAILTGVNGYLLTRAEIVDAARAVLWLTGSLAGRGWDDAVPLLVAMVVLVPVVLGCERALRMMEMGDDAALSLGVRVERVRLALLTSAVLLASFAAAAAGPVLFVALTAPHLARRLTRAPGPNLVATLCMGAALLVTADWLAQRAFPGRELPVGVVTGLLGGGYLVWLLIAERRAGRI